MSPHETASVFNAVKKCLGHILFHLKSYDKAVEVFEGVPRSRDEDGAHLYMFTAACLEQFGSPNATFRAAASNTYGEAILYIEEVDPYLIRDHDLNLDKNCVERFKNYLQDARNNQNAQDFLSKCIKCDSPTHLNMVSAACVRLNKVERIHPKANELFLRKGLAEHHRGIYNRAAKTFRRVSKTNVESNDFNFSIMSID